MNEKFRMKRTEDSLRDLCDNIKYTSIRLIQVPEEEKKKGYEKFFEEIIVENFPNIEKEIVNQVQERRVPYKINPRRNTPRHILIKLTKTKHKEGILKAAREPVGWNHHLPVICQNDQHKGKEEGHLLHVL